MQSSEMQMFNVGNLISCLNSSLKNGNLIELGNFEAKPLPRLRRNIEIIGTYPLTQTTEGRLIDGIFNYESEIRMGQIYVEAGFVDSTGDDADRYEFLELRTNSPLELRNGTLPACKVKFFKRTLEWKKPEEMREDFTRYGSPLPWLGFYVRDDLSRFMPSEQFAR